MLHENKPSLEEAIFHYGVPGMKWGVRKKQRKAAKAEAKADAKISKAINMKSDRRRGKALAKAIEAHDEAVRLRADARWAEEGFNQKAARRRQGVATGAKIAVAVAPFASRYARRKVGQRFDPNDRAIRKELRQDRRGRKKARELNLGFKVRELDPPPPTRSGPSDEWYLPR